MAVELRFGESAARQRAKKHTANTSHQTKIRRMDDAEEIDVTGNERRSV